MTKTAVERRGSRGWATALLLVLVLVLSACGGDDGGDDVAGDPTADPTAAGDATDAPAPTEPEDDTDPTAEPTDPATEGGTGEPEVTELAVGLIPIVDVAPLIIAQEAGYFEDEGLTVTTEFGVGGAALVPALLSGDIQVGFGNYVSHVLAIQEGFELEIVAEGIRAVEGFSGVFAMPDSGVTGPADLEGRTVSTNTLNNVGPVAINAVLQSEGADHEQVEYTEVPFPEAAATLERGDIDAAWVVQPFTALIQDQIGAELVLDPFSGPTAGFPVAGYAVTAEFAEANPNTVAAFQRALQRATDDAAAGEDVVRQAITTYTEIPPEVLENVVMPDFVATPDAAELQRVPDLMLEFGWIDEAFDFSAHISGS